MEEKGIIITRKEKPSVLVIGHTNNLSAELIAKLHSDYGEDLVIMDLEQAKELNILCLTKKPEIVPNPEPLILKNHPVIEHAPSLRSISTNKPWYTQFDKKRGKCK